MNGAPRLVAMLDRPRSGITAVYSLMQSKESLSAAAHHTGSPNNLSLWAIEDLRAVWAYGSFHEDIPWLVEMALPVAAMDFRSPLPVFEVRVVETTSDRRA